MLKNSSHESQLLWAQVKRNWLILSGLKVTVIHDSYFWALIPPLNFIVPEGCVATKLCVACCGICHRVSTFRGKRHGWRYVGRPMHALNGQREWMVERERERERDSELLARRDMQAALLNCIVCKDLSASTAPWLSNNSKCLGIKWKFLKKWVNIRGWTSAKMNDQKTLFTVGAIGPIRFLALITKVDT